MSSHPRVLLLCLALVVLAAPVGAATLRVGIDLNGEPMTFVDAKGVPRGFAVDIMNGIAREMGFEVVYVAKPWAEMMEDFTAARIDAIANITYTPARATFMDFTDPHIVMNGAIFVRKGDNSIKSPVDLRNRRIAVKPGGAPYEYLKAHDWAQQIVPTATLRDSLRMLAEGRADAALDARLIGLKNIRDEHLPDIEASEVELRDFAQRLHIGVHPAQPARIALLNDGLARLRTKGIYDAIYEKWIGPLEPARLRYKDIAPYLPAAAMLGAVIAAALFWQRRLLRQLAHQAEALGESEERLTLVLEGSEIGFWDWDLRTGHIARSERWATMLGYALAEIDGSLDGERALVHPDDRPAYESFQKRRQTGQTSRYDLEYRLKTKDGGWRWILNRGKVVARDPAGTPLRMAGTHADITDLKRAEEEWKKLHLKMLESQKLESLGVLAGGIAHDFNNLLTVILANATLVRSDRQISPGLDASLGDIEIAARRAADLCRQMLAYAGQGNFVLTRLDLSRLVDDTAHLLQVSISKKARLILQLERNLPPVEADASQLQQVVMNLVINASDALGDGTGEIRLRTWRGRPEPSPETVVHSFDLPAGECSCLEVADTGKGMDAATLARIFDPFFTTKFTGRGLGLAAVLGIVRTHRGTLTVTSTPGHGTTFRLYLPATAKPALPSSSSTAPLPPPTAATALGTILIADDEPAVLATTAALLRRQGYSAVLAADGHEAVRHFSADPGQFTAVVLDLTMPGLDGAEVLRAIRLINPAVRVLIMSGFSEQDVRKRLQGQDPVAILHKPFTFASLVERLGEVIRR